MKKIFAITFLFAVTITSASGQLSKLELKKADHHLMQYYFSLPGNWSPDRKWPVVIAIEDAGKQFKKNAERFSDGRKDMPFIIVVPFITTNGRQGHKDPTIYPYSNAVWDTIDRISICKFDIDGLQSIINDLKANFSASEKVFITGFEAGTHLVWSMIFQHPELLYAAAPVAGNYIGRCMETNSFSNDNSRIQLPINNFTGSEDNDFGVKGTYYYQYLEAKNQAIAHGYKNISETTVAGKAHVSLPQQVLEYFNKVWINVK